MDFSFVQDGKYEAIKFTLNEYISTLPPELLLSSGDRSWSSANWKVGGFISSCSGLHTKASLGKILNPELFPIRLLGRDCSIESTSMEKKCLCEWMNGTCRIKHLNA